MEIGLALRQFLAESEAGIVTAEPGFCIRRNPDTVRAPEVAFLSSAREREAAADDGRLTSGCPACAPDLAVEILSPSGRRIQVENKVGEWLVAGCREVWFVLPLTRESRCGSPTEGRAR